VRIVSAPARTSLSASVLLLQVAVIEFARNVLGLKEAHSAEFDGASPTPVVVFMPEGSKTHKGGTMRLGARKTILQTMDCITARLYQVLAGLTSAVYFAGVILIMNDWLAQSP